MTLHLDGHGVFQVLRARVVLIVFPVRLPAPAPTLVFLEESQSERRTLRIGSVFFLSGRGPCDRRCCGSSCRALRIFSVANIEPLAIARVDVLKLLRKIPMGEEMPTIRRRSVPDPLCLEKFIPWVTHCAMQRLMSVQMPCTVASTRPAYPKRFQPATATRLRRGYCIDRCKRCENWKG